MEAEGGEVVCGRGKFVIRAGGSKKPGAAAKAFGSTDAFFCDRVDRGPFDEFGETMLTKTFGKRL